MLPYLCKLAPQLFLLLLGQGLRDTDRGSSILSSLGDWVCSQQTLSGLQRKAVRHASCAVFLYARPRPSQSHAVRVDHASSVCPLSQPSLPRKGHRRLGTNHEKPPASTLPKLEFRKHSMCSVSVHVLSHDTVTAKPRSDKARNEILARLAILNQ